MRKRRLSAKNSLLGLVLPMMFLVGCVAGTMVAYEGPTLPKDKVAVIKSAVSGFTAGMTAAAVPTVSCIDGKEVTGEEIHVSPGKHQIQISMYHQPSSRKFRGNLEFEAQANHEYLANGAVVTGQPLIWVEDKITKQTIVQGVPIDQSFKRIQCP